MADGPKIDVGEIFGIVGATANQTASALDAGPSTLGEALFPTSSLDIDLGTVLLGAGVGAGLAYANRSSLAVGAGAGGVAAIVLRSMGVM